MGDLRKLLEIDWEDPPDFSEFVDYLEVNEEDPLAEGRDFAGVYAYLASLHAEVKAYADKTDRDLRSYETSQRESKKAREALFEAELSHELSKAYDRAVERLSLEAKDKGLRPPTVDRIKEAAQGDEQYIAKLKQIDETRKSFVDDKTLSERLMVLRSHEMKLDGLVRALGHRTTTVRLAGDLMIARTRVGV